MVPSDPAQRALELRCGTCNERETVAVGANAWTDRMNGFLQAHKACPDLRARPMA